MKIKITHPIETEEGILSAGVIKEVNDKQAQEYVDNDWAFEIVQEVKKIRKVKYDDRQN